MCAMSMTGGSCCHMFDNYPIKLPQCPIRKNALAFSVNTLKIFSVQRLPDGENLSTNMN
jgi:hypothetical protein